MKVERYRWVLYREILETNCSAILSLIIENGDIYRRFIETFNWKWVLMVGAVCHETS